jgi:hypothetical protein
MGKITTKIITERLGSAPETWTFFGQCYETGEQNDLKCAIMQRPSRYFFTLKPWDGGPGSRYISFEAIQLFKLRNPRLYRRLMIGVALLEMQNDGFDL